MRRGTFSSARSRPAPEGFTLIEIVIVVVVIGLLAVVGYPAYNDHLRKARRGEAQAALHDLAQFMERHYSRNGTYLGAELPITEVPIDSARKYYDLAFVPDLTDTTYTLQASPKGIMAEDACGSFYLLHTGRRSQGNAAANPLDRDCWRD